MEFGQIQLSQSYLCNIAVMLTTQTNISTQKDRKKKDKGVGNVGTKAKLSVYVVYMYIE